MCNQSTAHSTLSLGPDMHTAEAHPQTGRFAHARPTALSLDTPKPGHAVQWVIRTRYVAQPKDRSRWDVSSTTSNSPNVSPMHCRMLRTSSHHNRG